MRVPWRLGSTVAATLRTPSLVVDWDVAQRNADRMAATARQFGCALRPHVKTHKTVELALLQTGGRRGGIVVSTLAEAVFFADAGFDDMLLAVPITPDRLPAAAALTRRVPSFGVMVDQHAQLDALLAAPPPGPHTPWSVTVAVDSGYHRDGVNPQADDAVALAARCHASATANLAGIYTHGGHAYACEGPAAIRTVSAAERDVVVGFAGRLREAGVACPTVSVGSTPTCSHPPDDAFGLDGVDEIHPGNYVVYDTMQMQIGSCAAEDLAIFVLTRVIGHAPERNTMIVDMGWTAQGGGQGAEAGYGLFVDNPELNLRRLSQESGEVGAGEAIDFARYPVGSILRFAPHHSCAAVHCHPTMRVVRGGELVDGEQLSMAKGW